MNLDVTTRKDEWAQIRKGKNPLWAHTVYGNVFSTDEGRTYTISTEMEDESRPRPVHESRKV